MSRFAPFKRIDLPYRIINGVPLLATILIPAQISTSPRSDDKKSPVMVRWHGGGFVVGHRMYEQWFAQWLLDLALDHDAIIITADYRLLPESNGSDILSDVAHFWRWLQKDLPLYMQQESLPRPKCQQRFVLRRELRWLHLGLLRLTFGLYANRRMIRMMYSF